MTEPLLRPMTEADARELDSQRDGRRRLAESCSRCTVSPGRIHLCPDCELVMRKKLPPPAPGPALWRTPEPKE